MTNSHNPKFRLLVGWCSLMTSALLILSIYHAWPKTSETNTGNEGSNSIESNTKPDQQMRKGFWHGPSFTDYIHLIRDSEKTWIRSSVENSSLSLNNGTVEIKIGGLYHIHAQVTFLPTKPMKSKHQMETMEPMGKHATVILLKNKGPDTQNRKLSEVMGFQPGTLTMIRLVELAEGESISLKIEPGSLCLSNEAWHTYWEIVMYNSK